MRFQHLLILSFLIIATSCKKESDTEAPTISILAPSDGASYNVFDTILVRVDVSDNEQVKRVSVALLDNGVGVLPTVSREVGQQSANNIGLALPINNIQLETGQYSLRVRATDGANDENQFVSVFVQEEPKRFRGVIAVCDAGVNQEIHRFDSVLNQTLLTTLNMDRGVGALSSVSQQVVIGGGQVGGLRAIHVDDGSQQWNVPNLGIGTIPYFHHAHTSNNTVYVSSEDGFIRGFNQFGAVVFSGQATSAHRAVYQWSQADHIISEQVQISGPARKFVVYFNNSGIVANEFFTDLTIVEAFPRQDDDALLFGNQDGDGVIQTMSIDFGPGFEPRDFPGEPITAVEQLDANNYIVATTLSLYKYTYSNNNLQNLGTSSLITDMDYELISGSIYAAAGNELLSINPNSGSSNVIASFGSPVVKALPFCNK